MTRKQRASILRTLGHLSTDRTHALLIALGLHTDGEGVRR